MTHLLHFGESKLGPTKGMFYVACQNCRQVIWGEDLADATRTMERIACELREKPKVVCILCRREGQHDHLQ